jgi:hypothetical protein
MINLHCVGALERCTTFPNKLDSKLIEKMVIRYIPEFALLRENLKALKNRPNNRDLYDALYKVWRKSWWLKFPIKLPMVYRHRWILRMLRDIGKIYGKFVVR